MQIPRFFLTPADISLPRDFHPSGQPTHTLDLPEDARFRITNRAISNQVRKVLRLRAGDRIRLLDNEQHLFECQLLDSSSDALECQVVERRQLPPDTVRISVALGIIKGERFDLALQKLTELGVWKIIPIITSRCVVKIDSKDAKGVQQKLSRWQAIAKEAAEQSERATIPQIVAPVKYPQWISSAESGATDGIGIICAERIQKPHLRDILLGHSDEWKNLLATTDKTITLIVGPEGGLTDEEVDLAQKLGFMPVSLGHRILRSETAAMIALAQAIWCLEN